MDKDMDVSQEEKEFAVEQLIRLGYTPARAESCVDEYIKDWRSLEAERATRALRGVQEFSKGLDAGAPVGVAARDAVKKTGSEKLRTF